MWTGFLWSMISQPPRMLLYGIQRARRERARAAAAHSGSSAALDKLQVNLNLAVPAMQELLNTPLTTFPPCSDELWSVYKQAADAELTANPLFLGKKKAMSMLGVPARGAA
jgi:hypothetical protein